MGLSLTVLGASGSYPGPGSACSGYLVRSSSTTVWLDAGSGTLANLQRHVAIGDVDAIVLTHEHPDHWTDLLGYYIATKYYMPRDAVPVYAPESLRDHAYYHDAPLDWRVVTDADTVEIGDLRLTFSRTDHPPETLATRVDGDGRSIVYTADTGPGWEPARFGRGVDLLLSEATFLASGDDVPHHLSADIAGRFARDAAAQRLVVTHLQPGLDREACRAEAHASYGRDVVVATENEEYHL
ncbi:MAG TPA: MBL fold metallo-hydrolase [Acidimicrobiales bacterium]|nr:MBL fold metallo-hydrolase [Acidimicrobiales bacterium]